MRRNLMLTLALAAAISLGVTAVASAISTTVRAGNLILTVGGNVTPTKLPRKRYAPVNARFFGKIKTADGTHPPALREVIFEVDKDVKVNIKGYPVCRSGQLQARDTKSAKRVCGKTVLGEGLAHAEVSFPEQEPIRVASPITIFNGGGNARRMKLLIHTFITVPVPAAIVTQVVITKKGTGVRGVAKIPRIVGGSGSALDFNFKIGKTYRYKGKKAYYTSAKCPDGKFVARVKKALFKNETAVPGVPAQTVLKGTAVAPCKPKG